MPDSTQLDTELEIKLRSAPSQNLRQVIFSITFMILYQTSKQIRFS